MRSGFKIWLAVLVALQFAVGSSALMTLLPATIAQIIQVIIPALEAGTAAYLGINAGYAKLPTPPIADVIKTFQGR